MIILKKEDTPTSFNMNTLQPNDDSSSSVAVKNVAMSSINIHLESIPSSFTEEEEEENIFNETTSKNDDIPRFTSLSELYVVESANRTKIINFVKNNPTLDFYYTFNVPEKQNYTFSTAMNIFSELRSPDNICIAGSSALARLFMILNGSDPQWNPKDVDIFILNSKANSRFNRHNYHVDLIHSTCETAVELISSFDLPCCRVAYDFNFTFTVSIQALAAIFSRKMYIPKYMNNIGDFKHILDMNSTIKPEFASRSYISTWYDMMFNRLKERIVKYRSRGFAPQFYDTDYVLPWIKERFFYSEFEIQQSPSIVSIQENNESIISTSLQKYDDNLMKRLRALTGRSEKDTTDVLQHLYKLWDIKTYMDLVSLSNDNKKRVIDSVTSLPFKNALEKMWERDHDKVEEQQKICLNII